MRIQWDPVTITSSLAFDFPRMAINRTASEIAGVLDEIYRAADPRKVPRRFILGTNDLRDMAGRTRPLRWEFLGQVGFLLERRYYILMSHPRKGGQRWGFVSTRFAETWPAVADADVFEWAGSRVRANWAKSVLTRLLNLHGTMRPNPKAGSPIVFSERQFCRLVGVRDFDELWWSDLMVPLTTSTNVCNLVFFVFGPKHDRKFAITTFEHIRTWNHPTVSDWNSALARYYYDECE